MDTDEISERRDTSLTSDSMSRRGLLSAVGSVAVGTSFTNTTRAASAVGRPAVPDQVSGEDWSNPTDLNEESRDGIIEWRGIKTRNKQLKQQVIQEEDGFEELPLWQLYAWRVNQSDTPSNPSNGDESDEILSGILDGLSVSMPAGPLVVTADLGEIAEEAAESDDYVSRIATDVFTDQMEADYPVEGKVDVCEGLREPGWVYCSDEEDSYSNSVADVHTKYSFEMDHVVEGGWFDLDVTYRALFVVQTYDTNTVSNLRKTFLATGAVFPTELDGVDILEDYDFVDTSRKFIKNVR